MERLDHLEHLDKHLVDELAQVARETVRDELREQTRKQRRTAMLYAASGAVALYAGAALALAVGLALALGLPDWAAALITAAILGAVAYVLRGAARPSASRPTAEREAEPAAAGDQVGGASA
ncbi:phage holin family protein, partial [Streptomyces sp. NPDC047072]|uniref:phage holin family protein n=1 Tax=Streptomyces sp. NPDC047072 TaxID=3154809 RepID=UPI0033F8FBB6